ncbi:hypothetical protein SUGI_1104610 [Cryptomeria japonica]|nr:hypothetical protein SUGI_1104610 [Cryptomeria japonica]
MSQHTPQGNFISNATRGAVGVVHNVADLILPPALDSVLHGAARGMLDWAGGSGDCNQVQPCRPQPACTSMTPAAQPYPNMPPAQANISPSFRSNQSNTASGKQQNIENNTNSPNNW